MNRDRKKSPADAFLLEPDTSLLVLYHPDSRRLQGMGAKGSLSNDAYAIIDCELGATPVMQPLMDDRIRHLSLKISLHEDGFQPFILIPDAPPIQGVYLAERVSLQAISIGMLSAMLNVRLNNPASLSACKQSYNEEAAHISSALPGLKSAVTFSPLAQEVLDLAQHWFPVEPMPSMSGGRGRFF